MSWGLPDGRPDDKGAVNTDCAVPTPPEMGWPNCRGAPPSPPPSNTGIPPGPNKGGDERAGGAAGTAPCPGAGADRWGTAPSVLKTSPPTMPAGLKAAMWCVWASTRCRATSCCSSQTLRSCARLVPPCDAAEGRDDGVPGSAAPPSPVAALFRLALRRTRELEALTRLRPGRVFRVPLLFALWADVRRDVRRRGLPAMLPPPLLRRDERGPPARRDPPPCCDAESLARLSPKAVSELAYDPNALLCTLWLRALPGCVPSSPGAWLLENAEM